MIQALGGALLMANTAALLTDAFPPEHRGLALGLYQVVGLAGTFFALLAGGLLATVDWRLVFLINVPVSRSPNCSPRSAGTRHCSTS